MNALNILHNPWAIIPEKLFEIQEVYNRHLRGERLSIEQIEAKIGPPLENKAKHYEIINDHAVIPIHGIIAKRMSLFTRISGGVSTELVGRDIKEALKNPAVKGVVLDIDSPGGTVDGTQELAELIYNGRGQKPIISVSNGMMASAAYYIGAAADEIYISGDLVQTGSIGVVATHVDYSKQEEKWGVKTTEIYAGKYKRIASSYQPLSKEGKDYIQDQVDYVYSVFVNDVAKYRGVSVDEVLANMADARIFIGRQAVSAGLVDGVLTFDGVIEKLAGGNVATNFNSEVLKMETKMKALSTEERAKLMWNDDPDLRAEFQDDCDAWLAFCKAEKDGRIKITRPVVISGRELMKGGQS